MADLIFSDPDARRVRGFTWWVALSDGDSFASPTQWHTTEGSPQWRAFLAGDVNGDGRADLVAAKRKKMWSRKYFSWSAALSNGFSFLPEREWGESSRGQKTSLYLGDVTGDGAEDLVFSYRPRGWSSLRWGVAVSDPEGGAFGDESVWAGRFGALSWDGHGLFDYDGDGRMDILGWNHDGGMWDVSTLLSTGASFGPAEALDTFPGYRKDFILP
jgi:hypothetical protein